MCELLDLFSFAQKDVNINNCEHLILYTLLDLTGLRCRWDFEQSEVFSGRLWCACYR